MSHQSELALSQVSERWPDADLEHVQSCLCCGSAERTLAHPDVQDWSFYSAPGKWTYWSCGTCASLYLDPRPTLATVWRAYARYYTHGAPRSLSFIGRLKSRLANESWSHALGRNLSPRLHLPRFARWLLWPVQSRTSVPFVLDELSKLPAGRLMDVGCGNGQVLEAAAQLGWQATGIEIDPVAARAARGRRLDVLEGTYERLAEFPHGFDCIVCSHVFEHVHQPAMLLRLLAHALKPGGTLLLATPNATSWLRRHFGSDWRGLEAPRHLCIPSMHQLAENLRAVGFVVHQRPSTRAWTAAESERIRRRGRRLTARDKAAARRLAARSQPPSEEQYDFIEFICVKKADRGG